MSKNGLGQTILKDIKALDARTIELMADLDLIFNRWDREEKPKKPKKADFNKFR